MSRAGQRKLKCLCDSLHRASLPTLEFLVANPWSCKTVDTNSEVVAKIGVQVLPSCGRTLLERYSSVEVRLAIGLVVHRRWRPGVGAPSTATSSLCGNSSNAPRPSRQYQTHKAALRASSRSRSRVDRASHSFKAILGRSSVSGTSRSPVDHAEDFGPTRTAAR
jgi:hypothetical protein